MAANKAKKPVKNTPVSDCDGIKPEKLFPPKDENKSKPPKSKARNNPFNRQRLSAGGIFILKKR